MSGGGRGEGRGPGKYLKSHISNRLFYDIHPCTLGRTFQLSAAVVTGIINDVCSCKNVVTLHISITISSAAAIWSPADIVYIDIDKFNYLQSLVEQSAAEAIAGLCLPQTMKKP